VRIRPTKGIGKWQDSAAASRGQAGGGAHLSGEEETVKRGDISGHFPPL
jgi:hypothetical protein